MESRYTQFHESPRHADLSRRRFLRGAGGVTLGLPLLDVALRGRGARAATRPTPIAIVVNGNGVQQAGFGSEAERFWPTTPGPLTKAAMTSGANAERAVCQLADLADRLLVVRGIMVTGGTNGCDHQAGAIQHLTAAPMNGSGHAAVAGGPSVDNYVAKAFGQPESLLLYAGTKNSYNTDGISWRAAGQLRVGEGNPFTAYTKLVGLTGGTPMQDAALAKLASRRKSVNDLVRTELRELLARTDLSRDDRTRLDQHLSTVRDLETAMTATVAPPDRAAFKAIDGRQEQNGATRQEVIRLQQDLMAFALAAQMTPIAVLQSSNITDDMVYTIGGTVIPRFHLVSHRNSNDTGLNDGTMPLAEGWHHEIDKIRAREFKYLADKLASYTTPLGSLLDVGCAIWTNTLGAGNHIHHNLPWIFAGRANGAIKTGRYLNVSNNTGSDPRGNVTVNRLLNDVIAIAGVRRADGSLVDDFGDASLPKGFVPDLRA